MATRSTIALEFADGTVGQIYCHFDGYLSNNGKILLNHYMDPFKVRQLIDLGDLSVLSSEIGQKHKFDGNDRVDWCMFYGRDPGDIDVAARYFQDFDDHKANHQYEEYEYILRQVNGEAVWYVNQGNGYEPLMEAYVEVLRQQNEEAVVQ